MIFLFGSKALQNAVAEGETRTITMHHIHTDEDITITYKRDGRYDEAALEKLNWFLRDWRRSQETRMDPHLIDLIWEVQRETGSKSPVYVVCGYRSPATNAMLRRRSSGVARFSQHMLGHAMDFYIPGVPLAELRVIGLRLQRGGVGFYPTSGSPFVHMDTGGVRMWPRMTREQLLNVFPDGRTAYIPSDGRPLPGYELALADIKKRGGEVGPGTALASNEGPINPVARLIGLFKRHAEDEDDDDTGAIKTAAAAPVATAAPAAQTREQPNPLAAALIRRAERERAAAAKPAIAVAAAPAPSGTSPAAATLTPGEIVLARGFWDEVPSSGNLAASTNSLGQAAAAPRRLRVGAQASRAAPPSADSTPWGNTEDRVPPELALAYAAQPDSQALAAAAKPAAAATVRTLRGAPAVRAQPLAVPPATTIAVKREEGAAASSVAQAAPQPGGSASIGTSYENPWLRAMLISPDTRRYLTALVVGDQDLRTLAPLLHKPDSLVVMAFADGPATDLAQDHFSGRAIVAIPTVKYRTQTALR